MRGPAEIRKRLESTSYPDLGTMMEGYAQAAVERGAGEFRAKLDFSSESVDALDEILVLVGESPELDLDFEVRLWGSYLGIVLRRGRLRHRRQRRRSAGRWALRCRALGPTRGDKQTHEAQRKDFSDRGLNETGNGHFLISWN